MRIQQLLTAREDDGRNGRLVTLTGFGGCGKTRLALELGRRLLPQFPDGLWLADLSSTAEAALVPSVVLTAIGGGEASDQTPVESLLRQLSGRRSLLVLDNCEHLLDACARLVARLLASTSELHVLTTSRQALGIPGEFAWRVPPLSTPEQTGHVDAEELLACESAQLLVDRIQHVDPGFAVTPSNASTLAHICGRLDGIPLALELAAARAGAMSVQEIAAGLDAGFHLLAGGSRIVTERHRTLYATIDWSYALLDSAEQTLFRRLAVFAGGCAREAAELVCGFGPLAASEVFEILIRLVDQSLVNVLVEDGRTRYRFLDTVREYSAEQLRSSNEVGVVEACHREWYLTFAERAARELTRPDQVTWYRQLTLEHDNMRAALDACEDDPVSAEARLRIVAAMGQFWWPRKAGEGRRRLADALARAPTEPSPARAAALSWLARFELYYGDPLVGQDLALNALSDARAVDDPVSMSRALVGLVLASGDDLDARRSFIEELVSIAGRSAHKTLEASALSHLSMVALDAGDVQRSRLLAQESDALARAIGDAWTRAGPLSYLGWSAMAEGRLDDAESHFRTLVDLGEGWGGYHNPIGLVGLGRVNVLRGDFRQAREVYGRMLTDLRETSAESLVLADALLHMASVEELEGRHERAQRLAGANEAWHAAHGGGRSTWEPTVRAPLLRGQVPIPPVPSEPELVRARQAGRAMTLDQAATYALDTFDRE